VKVPGISDNDVDERFGTLTAIVKIPMPSYKLSFLHASNYLYAYTYP